MTDPTSNLDFPRAEYEALTTRVGLVDFSSRTQIEVRGNDRQKFLHNLCTNDIKKLTPGSGCEAFFTTNQGRILAFAYMFAGRDCTVIETVPDQASLIIKHLDRFLFREDVRMTDRAGAWAEFYLAGPQAAALINSLVSIPADSPLHQPLGNMEVDLAGITVELRHVDFTHGGGYLIAAQTEHAPALWQALRNAGAVVCGEAAWQTARVEHGTPLYSVDITESNLPQEAARDSLAISFKKGCYIGQETVARIDALGHVNWLLHGVRFGGSAIPSAGTELFKGGKPAGRVTSAVFSPALNAPLAIAYVRRGSDMPGTVLQTSADQNATDAQDTQATIVRLPIER